MQEKVKMIIDGKEREVIIDAKRGKIVSRIIRVIPTMEDYKEIFKHINLFRENFDKLYRASHNKFPINIQNKHLYKFQGLITKMKMDYEDALYIDGFSKRDLF